MTKGAQLAVGATAIALLLGWYAITNLGPGASYQYFQTLAEFQTQSAALQGKSLRIHGYVANDSIARNLQERHVRFMVQNDPPHAGGAEGSTLLVEYRGLDTPDLFRDGAEVVVEGHLQGEGAEVLFIADNVLAKCPSKFEAKVGAERSEETTL